MKRLVITVSLLVLLLVLALLGGYVYLSTQDAEHVRQRIEASLESALGRDVALKGPLTVTLSPLPAITISDVEVANASWGTRPQMLSVKEVELVPALARLLVGRIELRQVRITGARLFLENGPDGQGNWQFKSAGAPAESELPVHVRSLVIDDLQAAYANPSAPMTREIALERLSMYARPGQDEIKLQATGQVLKQALAVDASLGRFSDLMEGRPFPVELDATIGQTRLSISGRIDDPDFRDYKGIHLHFEATGQHPVVLMGWTRISMPPLESFTLQGDLQGDDGELGADNLRCHLQTSGYDLTMSGSIANLPELKGLAIDFEGTADSITQMLPWSDETFTAKGQFNGSGHLSGDRTALALDHVSMSGRFPGVEMKIDGSVRDLHEGGVLDAKLSLSVQGLKSVGQRLHVTLPDLDAVAADGTLSGTLLAPVLKDIEGTLTEGSLTAKVAGDISQMIPELKMDLAIDVSGRNFKDLGELWNYPDLPATDSVSATGRLRGTDGTYDLAVTGARLDNKEIGELQVSGTVNGIGARPTLDLAMRLTGKDLAALPQVKAVGLPDTDEYRIEGTLRGPASAPDLDDVDAEARLDKITVTVKGRFPDVLKFGHMDARVEVQGDDLASLGRQFSQRWPESRSFRLGGRVHGNTAEPTLEDLEGQLGADEVDVSFKGKVDDVLKGKGFDLQVQASATSLGVFFPLGGRAWDKLGKSEARFDIQGNIERYHVDLAELHAGNSSFTGEFTYSRSGPDQPRRIEGAFRQSLLDLTPWLQAPEHPAEADEKSSRDPAKGPVFSNTPLDLGWMKALELDVDLSAVELAAGEDRIEVVHSKLDLDGGSLTLDPMQLSYEGSTIVGTLALSDSPAPRLKLQTVTRDLNFGQLARRSG